MYLAVLTVIAATFFKTYDCLDCYQCSEITEITECHSFAICSEDEKCTEAAVLNPAIAIVGRQLSNNALCSQCCTSDACNKRMCSNAHTYPVGLNDGLYVRLVGEVDYSGRLEVSLNGSSWGTVCSNYFGYNDAMVVCKMLGFSTPYAFSSLSAKSGSGPILLNEVDCLGTESSLLQCRHSTWGTHNCNHGQDIAVTCPYHGLYIRLVGNTNNSGRVEVSVDNISWGTVCSNGFDDNAAMVVCRMLGFPTLGAFYTHSSLSGNGSIALDDVQCTGTENSLFECRRNQWGSSKCAHTQDVAVTCPYHGLAIRLVGNTNNSGRVEVSTDYVSWGTVCVNGFDDNAAMVVCRMLGFPTLGAFYSHISPSGKGLIALAELQCTGTENSLFECRRNQWGTNNCGHTQDVTVTCPYHGLAIRLVGNTNNSGRVEVSTDYVSWGTVCVNGFDDNAAMVVCRMVGFPTSSSEHEKKKTRVESKKKMEGNRKKKKTIPYLFTTEDDKEKNRY